ncbi:MAG: HAD family phosphatase [Muribaculaceae bacterium]|nr:HAD family phosphatase [Muribaculaceae bacterium]
MMREYTTIIFDLGGVIINLKKQNCIDAFKALGYDSVDKMLSEYRQDGEFLALEEGRVSPEEWRNIVRQSISSPVMDEQIDDAFNAFLVDIPIEKLRMLRALKSKYRIAMLSNTNKVMFESKIPELFKIEGLTIEDYFDDFFLSYKMGMSKPSPEIFIKVAEELGIEPNEALFIDDSQANVDAAAKLGFQTMCVKPYTDFSDKLL